MSLAAAYGLTVAAMMLCVWRSRAHVLQKLGFCLLADWALGNAIVQGMGYDHAPLMIPSLHGALAVLVAMVGYKHRSQVALVVFLCYALAGVVHVGAFVTHRQATYAYYATLNLLFLAQLVTVGATGARLAVRHWAAGSRQRPRAHPARG